MLFAVFAYDWNLQDRLAIVGETYDCPWSALKMRLHRVSPDQRRSRVLSKNQFFYDIYHPSNMGHRIMADCLMNLWNKAAAYAGTDHTDEFVDSRIATGTNGERAVTLNR